MTERCEFWDYGQSICVLTFDFPLPEHHRANILSTAYSLRHQCKLGGGSASISGTSVYRGSKRGRRVVRRPRRAKSDCPTTQKRKFNEVQTHICTQCKTKVFLKTKKNKEGRCYTYSNGHRCKDGQTRQTPMDECVANPELNRE